MDVFSICSLYIPLYTSRVRYLFGICPLRASFFRYLCIVFVSKNLHFSIFVRHSLAQISRSWGSIFLSFVYSFITSALLVCLYFLYNALHMRCILLREFRYVVFMSDGLLRIQFVWESKDRMSHIYLRRQIGHVVYGNWILHLSKSAMLCSSSGGLLRIQSVQESKDRMFHIYMWR